MENKYLKQQLLVSEDNADGSYCKVVEHLHNCLKHNSRINVQGPGGSFPALLVELKKELHLLKEKWYDYTSSLYLILYSVIFLPLI